MKTLISRFTGILLILAAIGGFLIAITGLVGIWQLKPDVLTSVQSSLDLLDKTLETTAEGLDMTQKSLLGAQTSLQAMQTTLKTTTSTMQSTEPLISSLSDLAAQDLPATVIAAQNSLDSAAESAQVIDAVLRALSFLPGINYNPNTPLAASLQALSANMDNLPDTFIVMQSNLEDTSQNLQTIQVDLLLVIDSLKQIETSLTDSETVISGYQDSIIRVKKQIDMLSSSAPGIINAISTAATIFLIWMAIAQLSLLIQGWQLIESTTSRPPAKSFPKSAPSKKVAAANHE